MRLQRHYLISLCLHQLNKANDTQPPKQKTVVWPTSNASVLWDCRVKGVKKNWRRNKFPSYPLDSSYSFSLYRHLFPVYGLYRLAAAKQCTKTNPGEEICWARWASFWLEGVYEQMGYSCLESSFSWLNTIFYPIFTCLECWEVSLSFVFLYFFIFSRMGKSSYLASLGGISCTVGGAQKGEADAAEIFMVSKIESNLYGQLRRATRDFGGSKLQVCKQAISRTSKKKIKIEFTWGYAREEKLYRENNSQVHSPGH